MNGSRGVSWLNPSRVTSKTGSQWIITKMFQEPIGPIFVCKVGYLALDYDGEGVDSFFQFTFLDCKDNGFLPAYQPYHTLGG